MTGKPVIFTYVGTAYLRVIQEIERIQPSTYLVYGENIFPTLKKVGVDCLAIVPELEKDVRDKAVNSSMADLLENYEKRPLPGFWPSDLGWPEPWLVAAQMAAERFKQERIREQVLLVDMLDEAVQRYRPNLALLWEDVLLDGKTLALFFKKRGIPVLHMLHGMGALFHNAHDRVWTDRIAVQGERTRQWYLRWGNDPKKIVVTGAPYWDVYESLRRTGPTAAFREKFNLRPDRKVVLFCSTWTHGLSAHSDPTLVGRAYDLFLQAVRRLESEPCDWLVKLHPSDQKGKEWYRRKADEAGANRVRIVEGDANPEPIVHASDVVVCADSLLGVAGILCGKPVINLPLVRYHDPLFQPHDPVLQVTDAPSLAEGIRRALGDPALAQDFERKRPRSIYELNYMDDGKAAERIAHLAMGMTESRGFRGRSFVYYSHAREEVEPLIPREAERILDVGCATGAFGAHVKSQRPWVHVTGVELVAEAAAEAGRRLDRVITGDARDPKTLGEEKFDCIILSDVLEHLDDPWGLLESLQNRLTPQGCIVSSIPNVGHWSVIGQLLSGRWSYAEEGILDRDHIRFFTLQEIRTLFESTGWVIEEMGARTTPPHAILPGLQKVAADLRGDAENAADEMRTFQYLVRARPRQSVVARLLSEGRAHLDTAQWEEAARKFEEAIQLDDSRIESHLAMTRALLGSKKLARAFQVLSRISSRSTPDEGQLREYYLLLGEARLAAERLDEASQAFRALLAVDPNSFAGRVGLLRMRIMSPPPRCFGDDERSHHGRLASGGAGETSREIDELAGDAGNDPDRRVEIAALRVLSKDHAKARDIFLGVLEMNGDHRRAIIGLASCAATSDHKREALRHLRSYLALHAADYEIRYLLILFLSETGEESACMDEIKRLLALNPEHGGARRLLVKVTAAPTPEKRGGPRSVVAESDATKRVPPQQERWGEVE